MAMKNFAVTPGFKKGGIIFQPEQLSVLGSIVGENAEIEMTNFKQLYVKMDETYIDEVQEKLKETGLEIYPAGFFTKSLIVCNFCRGEEETRIDVAKALDQVIAGLPVPSPLQIGYAGCALGTSEPLLKDIAVVKMKDSFDIYLGGDAKGLKATLGKLFLSRVTEDKLNPIVLRLITYFQEHGKKKEKFSRFIKRITMEKLVEVVADQTK